MMVERKQDRVWRVIGTLLIVVLLVTTAGTAFLAGFGVSKFIDTNAASSSPAPTDAPPAEEFTPPPAQDSDQETFQLFWEVWEIVQENYYGEIPAIQQATYGAIQGMLDTLDDPYTYFVEPQIAAIFNEDIGGSFEGIGAYVQMREDDKLEIAGIIENSPAETVDLQTGDRVLAVDGQSIV